MKLTVKTKLNERQTVTMDFDGKMDDCLKGANAMLAFKGYCQLCMCKDILLQVKVAKGFTFTELVCTECNAKAQFGQFKEGGYFLKQWEKYEGHGNVAGGKIDTTPTEEVIDPKMPF